jgi:Xaa-Pro aminopeptidase
VHLAACRSLAASCVDMGLLRGDVDGLVESGAHAAFFPHGVGHLLGHDVHDLELYGDRAGYAPGRTRSDQFGLASLRLDRDLVEGMAVTIEPGFYVVPAILDDAALRERLGDSVRWDEARRWLPFGGIRIEDDVVVTADGCENLTAAIPKAIAEVETLVGSGSSVETRFG